MGISTTGLLGLSVLIPKAGEGFDTSVVEKEILKIVLLNLKLAAFTPVGALPPNANT